MQKILIVEDDIDIQDILKNHLTDAGYEVVIAGDGVEGSDEKDQIRGFEQQIDDYIPKPFSTKILLYKIAAILRRGTTENQNKQLLTYKELRMDIDGFHLYSSEGEIILTGKEFALLRLMPENQGKVFTRQMLIDRLWNEDVFVENRIVDSYIKNIRKKLGADYIRTIRGVGYRIDKED